MTAEDLPEADPFTTERLALKDGKWPLALPCKHVYNYSTVFALKSKSKTFALDKCVGKSCLVLQTSSSLIPFHSSLCLLQQNTHWWHGGEGEASTRHSSDADDQEKAKVWGQLR